MKVTIGKYKNWFGPYQLAQALCFWMKDDTDYVHKFGEWLAHGSVRPAPKKGDTIVLRDDRPMTMLYKFLTWIHTFRISF